MMADETVTCDVEELLGWLTEKGHPVLGLEPLMQDFMDKKLLGNFPGGFFVGVLEKELVIAG